MDISVHPEGSTQREPFDPLSSPLQLRFLPEETKELRRPRRKSNIVSTGLLFLLGLFAGAMGWIQLRGNLLSTSQGTSVALSEEAPTTASPDETTPSPALPAETSAPEVTPESKQDRQSAQLITHTIRNTHTEHGPTEQDLPLIGSTLGDSESVLHTASTGIHTVGEASRIERLSNEHVDQRTSAAPVFNATYESSSGTTDESLNSLAAMERPPINVADPLQSRPRVAKSIGDDVNTQSLAEASSSSTALDAKSDREVVQLLASIQPKLRRTAIAALQTRGWPEEHVQLAAALASGTESQRLAIVATLAKKKGLRPQPWLMWMAAEGQTKVRQRAVQELKGLVDPPTRSGLYLLLEREQNEVIRQELLKLIVDSPK